jgi:hypothetical protein
VFLPYAFCDQATKEKVCEKKELSSVLALSVLDRPLEIRYIR